jgi:hypothetical protein
LDNKDIFLLTSSVINIKNKNILINNEDIFCNKEYIQQFWVGLLEGDGTITVDKPSNGNTLRIRLVISLLNFKENLEMLKKIQEIIGGNVRIERKNKYVTWTTVKKNDVLKCLSILSKYPLLTSRKQLQLAFANKCILNPDIKNFIKDRNEKYKKINLIRRTYNLDNIPYFNAWLSGFIEAEGNFSLVLYSNKTSVKKASFSIGQIDDLAILELIKDYFKSNNKIITYKKLNKVGLKYYQLNLTGNNSRILIKNHFNNNPLLGYKKISYSKWITHFYPNNY